MNAEIHRKKIYITSILISLLIVESFFLMQVIFVLENFKIQYAIVPTFLGITIGILIGKVQVLKKELTSKAKLFHTIADQAREFSYFKKIDGAYEYVSPAVTSLTGYTQEDFYDNHSFFDSLISPKDHDLWFNHVHDMTKTEESHESIELRIIHKNGHEVWINHNCSAVYEDDEKIGVRSVNSDISKRKSDEEAIYELSVYDNLTSLPNRLHIFDSLDKLTEQNISFSVLFLDLNRFKKINDSLGHQVGDNILKQVAGNLKECLNNDNFVGRLGGDEFVVILKNKTTKEQVLPYIDRLFELIEKDYHIDEFTFYIGVSIGISFYPADSNNVQELLACADKAMYKAKSASSSNFVFYNDLLKDYKYDDFLLEKELRQVVKNRDLEIYLQPKYDTNVNKIISYEALIRWQKDGRFISPAVFIPIAEETGLIKDVTLFVIEEVFSIAKRWSETGKTIHPISINVSMVDFMSDKLIHNIQDNLKRFDVKAQWFELEMTESIFLDNSQRIEERIHTLIDMGFSIALDDFGTGYSSLSYLTRFPINTLKIDKIFIDNLTTNYEKGFPLIKSILTIADDLHLNVVIEGVETEEQLNIISSLGLFVIQGYYFYKPMSLEEVEKITHK